MYPDSGHGYSNRQYCLLLPDSLLVSGITTTSHRTSSQLGQSSLARLFREFKPWIHWLGLHDPDKQGYYRIISLVQEANAILYIQIYLCTMPGCLVASSLSAVAVRGGLSWPEFVNPSRDVALRDYMGLYRFGWYRSVFVLEL
jgi:hypothetical protein